MPPGWGVLELSEHSRVEENQGRKREARHTTVSKEAKEVLGTRDRSHAPQLRQQRLQHLQPVPSS